MGKYTKLKKSMVKFEQPTDWQQEIDAYKQEFIKSGNVKLGEKFSSLKDQKSGLEKQIRELNTQMEALSQILVDRLEDEEVTSFQTEDGVTIFIKDERYVSVPDKQVLNRWVREQGMEDLLTVHYQTLSAIVKERLERGDPLPPGVAVFIKSSVQRRNNN